MLIWFRRLLSYQGHAICAAAPSPDAPAAQSEIEPQVHSALGVRFFACPLLAETGHPSRRFGNDDKKAQTHYSQGVYP